MAGGAGPHGEKNSRSHAHLRHSGRSARERRREKSFLDVARLDRILSEGFGVEQAAFAGKSQRRPAGPAAKQGRKVAFAAEAGLSGKAENGHAVLPARPYIPQPAAAAGTQVELGAVAVHEHCLVLSQRSEGMLTKHLGRMKTPYLRGAVHRADVEIPK